MSLSSHFHAQLAALTRAQAEGLYDGMTRLCESPIEAAFGAAFVLNSQIQYGMSVELGMPDGSKTDWRWGLAPQQKLWSKYRVDFIVWSAGGGKPAQLIVECDGHDFHERTKEQAMKDRSRDRFMLGKNQKVFRFTGREIFQDAFKCAEEVAVELIRQETSN